MTFATNHLVERVDSRGKMESLESQNVRMLSHISNASCPQQENVGNYFDEECPGDESGTETLLSACSQSEGVIELLHEEDMEGQDSQEEHTPEKAMIQIELPDMDTVNEGNHLGCTTMPMREKVSGTVEKNQVVADETAFENNVFQHNALSVRLQRALLQESTTESSLVRMLWRQLESLAQREKEVERTLSNERIETLVSKVEEEVEFEGIVEDVCLRLRAEGEYMDMERREKEWERERREVRLEEEVELLRNKVDSLEEEIKIVNAEKDFALQKKQDEIDDLLCNVQLHSQGVQKEEEFTDIHMRPREALRDSQEDALAALRKMLCIAEEKAEQEHKALKDLEETFQNDEQRWNDMEQQYESQIYALEKELNGMKVCLKEKESVISIERERRRQYGFEIDKILAFWREESSVYYNVCQRLKVLESRLDDFKERAMQLKLLLSAGETEIEVLVANLLKDLEEFEAEDHKSVDSSKQQQLFEWELIERWKAQRDLLEDERDKLEEKLDLLTRQKRDDEKEAEATWQEKERFLVQKLKNVEAKLKSQELVWKKKSATLLKERGMWELEADAYRKDWELEREKLQAMMVDREHWMEENAKEWSTLLDAKEEELCTLRSFQKRLGEMLSSSKQHLVDIKKQLRKRIHRSKRLRSKVQNGFEKSEESEDLCPGESDADTSCSKDNRGNSEVETGEIYLLDIEQLATHVAKEIRNLSKVIAKEQEQLEKERTEVRIGTEQLKDERKELEQKVSDALNLMEDMKIQIKSTEGQMEQERKQMELILMDKIEEVECLKKTLSTKEQEYETCTKKLQDEILLIEKEIEKERKEREEVMDLHFTSRKKLMKEMKDKEAKWEKEVEAMAQEMQDLRNKIEEKDNQILRLRKMCGGSESHQELDLTESAGQEPNPGSAAMLSGDPALSSIVRSSVEMKVCGDGYSSIFFNSRDVEWQDVIGKIAGFDKQIAEAMVAIQSLKEELNVKEKELQRARLEREQEMKESQENRLFDTQREFDWGERERVLLRDKEELIKLLEAEKADTADAMSILQGAVRELQWTLKQYRGVDDNGEDHGDDDASPEHGTEIMLETQKFSGKDELVKVHTSHLEELDRFILDLKSRAEEAEKRARAAEVALAVQAVKESAKNTGSTSALVKFKKGWTENDLSSQYKGSRRSADNLPDSGSTSFRMSRQEQRWQSGSIEQGHLWDVGASSPGIDGTSSSGSSSWMTVRGSADDNFVMHDPFQQGALTLAVSTPPPRSQRRWLVDASWLENVRKEQASLRQQLELERQQVSSLRQVEVENRWIKETIMQALEQKRESDTRVLELERKVAFLEAMITKKGGKDRSPLSSPFYKGLKS